MASGVIEVEAFGTGQAGRRSGGAYADVAGPSLVDTHASTADAACSPLLHLCVRLHCVCVYRMFAVLFAVVINSDCCLRCVCSGRSLPAAHDFYISLLRESKGGVVTAHAAEANAGTRTGAAKAGAEGAAPPAFDVAPKWKQPAVFDRCGSLPLEGYCRLQGAVVMCVCIVCGPYVSDSESAGGWRATRA